MFGLRCPDCELIISDEQVTKLIENPEADLIQIFKPFPTKTEEQLRVEAEHQAQFEEFLKTLNMVKCPCGNFMEVVKGTVDYRAKDALGQVIPQ